MSGNSRGMVPLSSSGAVFMEIVDSAPNANASVSQEQWPIGPKGGLAVSLDGIGAGGGLELTSREIRIPYGQCGAMVLPTQTYQIIFQCDAEFDAIRPIFQNASGDVISGIKFCVAASADWADKVGNSLAWVDGTFGGAATGSLTAGAAQRPSLLVGDFTPCASLPRTDGGRGYLACIRTMIPTLGTLNLTTSDSGADLKQWNDLTFGAIFSNRIAGDSVTNKASHVNNGARADINILGIELLSRGKVVSSVQFGDSITKGQGVEGLSNINYGQRAATTLSKVGGTVFANGNCGWSSQNTSQFLNRALDFLAVVQPSLCVYAAFSPNDTAGALTQAQMNTARFRIHTFVTACLNSKVHPVIWAGLPAASAKGWNAASEDVRLAFVNDVKNKYANMATVIDMNITMSDGLYPANIKAGLSADNLHPNAAGHDVMAGQFIKDVLSAV